MSESRRHQLQALLDKEWRKPRLRLVWLPTKHQNHAIDGEQLKDALSRTS